MHPYSSHSGIIKLKNGACDLSLCFLTGDRSPGNVMVVVDSWNGGDWKTVLKTPEERHGYEVWKPKMKKKSRIMTLYSKVPELENRTMTRQVMEDGTT
jgi:hypothetical protein